MPCRKITQTRLAIPLFAGELLVDHELPVVGCEGVPVGDELAVASGVVDLLAEGEEVAARDDPAGGVGHQAGRGEVVGGTVVRADEEVRALRTCPRSHLEAVPVYLLR